MRTYGTITFDEQAQRWTLQVEPQVSRMVKRVFQGGKKLQTAGGLFSFPNTGETVIDLQWLTLRYPLKGDMPLLAVVANQHKHMLSELERVFDPDYVPPTFEMALPPREYQRRGADLYLKRSFQLCADHLGLGKTVSSIASLTDPRTLPAVVVCPPNLMLQWQRSLALFMPDLHTHILKGTKQYELPKKDGRQPDVLISSYHRLSGWADWLAGYISSVIFDEAQELRHRGTGKYDAAKRICHAACYRLMNTATPIYNLGGEIFSLVDLLSPGFLGTWDEFRNEWCGGGYGDKPALADPAAFGAHLREHHVMIRRTREEVGRELPELTKVTHMVDSDAEALDNITGAAGELARILLAESESKKGARMQAAGELDMLVRQATGIAKAGHVAAFVELLLQSGEPVVMWGWHRAVYEIWLEALKAHKPAMYTGTETPKEKDHSLQSFIRGDTNLLIMSLRSGAGADGLQGRCKVGVVGELDWSPGVIEQCLGRLHRDGQTDPVTGYFCLSDDGSDPLMAHTLGLKTQQVEGLLGVTNNDTVLKQVDTSAVLRQLAEAYLKKVS